jgi:NAD(P)-dependent dehydrogenase (short-subunit alcohol dehydrogenase family)
VERLAGKVAIITGAASGAGRATALMMAAEGASVAVADINGPGATDVAEEITALHGKAVPIVVDVREEQSVAEMVDATMGGFGRLDVLNNNAADHSNIGASDGEIADLSVEVWDRIMAANLRSVMLGCKHAVPAMLRNAEGSRGSIINTSSIGGLSGHVTNAAYGTAKAGILMLTKYVATMYGRRGIRCNTIAPGLFIRPETMGNFSDEFLGVSRSERLLERCGTPDDIAAASVFLASDEAGYITGETLVVDGGFMAHRPSYTLRAWQSENG